MNKTYILILAVIFFQILSCNKSKKFIADELKNIDPDGIYLSIEDAQKLKFNGLDSDSILPLKKNSLNSGYFYILRFDSLSKKFVKQCLINPKYQTERQTFSLSSDSIQINQDVHFIMSGAVLKDTKVYSSEDSYQSKFDTLNGNNILIFTKKCKIKGVHHLIAKIKIQEKHYELKYNYCVF